MRAGLSKTRLLNWRQCAKRLWLDVHLPADEKPPVDPSAELVFRQGHEVGAVAQQLHAGGQVIAPDNDLRGALASTRAALDAEERTPLFEATFERDGLLVRADVLAPLAGGAWSLREVKSSTGVKDPYVADVAIQRWVLQGAGVRVADSTLLHVDSEWVYGGDGDYRGLLAAQPLDAAIAPLAPQVPAWLDGARRTLAEPMPPIAMGEQCDTPYPCPYQGHCEREAGVVEYPVTLLPNKHGKVLARALAAQGYRDLRAVPAHLVAAPDLQLIHQVTASGRPYLDPTLRAELDALPWPRAYLDFETINFAVPRWAGTRPYQQVPFQWSCHVEASPGRFEHAAFLRLDAADPRRECAQRLVEVLRGVRTIFVYSAPFERGRIFELAELYPELAPELLEIADALFDLLPLVRRGYYHPDMRGSRSLKAVLPTIAGADPYGELDTVRDGAGAQLAYLQALDPRTGAAERARIERQLLAYCGLDTWATVVLAYFLAGRPLRGSGLASC